MILSISPFIPYSNSPHQKFFGFPEPKGDQFRFPSKAPKLLTQEEVGKGEEGLVADEARWLPSWRWGRDCRDFAEKQRNLRRW